ncbi:hypothetical protein GALL_366420 [mine drainage metagenome]|uniref:Uncharacterized protein n=1 Tax=mine drainage metagenome TaxID=410659 RepID=A0A1J5R0A1_9ZZZZ
MLDLSVQAQENSPLIATATDFQFALQEVAPVL